MIIKRRIKNHKAKERHLHGNAVNVLTHYGAFLNAKRKVCALPGLKTWWTVIHFRTYVLLTIAKERDVIQMIESF